MDPKVSAQGHQSDICLLLRPHYPVAFDTLDRMSAMQLN